MQIDFLADAPAYRDANLTVVFAALVDGEPVPCAISVEALEDHFSVKSCDRAGWISAFDAARSRETAARFTLENAADAYLAILSELAGRPVPKLAEAIAKYRYFGVSGS